MLAREHADFREFGLRNENGKLVPNSPKAADYWQWAQQQSDEVWSAANSDSAEDISAALSLYKWERQHKDVIEETRGREFQEWFATQPPAVAGLLGSPRLNEREYVLRLYAQHLDLQDRQTPVDPKTTARVDQIAARRQQQAKASPSTRSSAAPAQAAATGGEDADWASVQAGLAEWRRKQSLT